jgi:hypothetical protein
MAERFFMDGPALKRDTEHLHDTGHKLGAAFSRLTGVLDEHYGCWGEDDIGKGFAENYVDPEKKFRENGKLVSDAIPGLADDIEEARVVFAGVDEENAERIDKTVH